MWKRASNSDSVRPLETDETSSKVYVYVRRNFALIPAIEGEEQSTPEHWEYDEWKMTKEQYEVYRVMKSEQEEQEDAILELADLVGDML